MADSPSSPIRPQGDPHVVIKEGYLSKRGQMLGGWQREYYALRGDGLYAYVIPDSTGRHKKRIAFSDDCTVNQVISYVDDDFLKQLSGA